ncbi:MAG: hypothetical protein HY717_06370 [Planctomycetes bacterium]|nr:hypothetical protein [Planctomycetota bacterium]
MKLNEKQKIILAIVVVTLLVGALAALNFFKYRERSQLLARLETLKGDERKANDMIRQIPELRKKRQKLADTIDQYASILPPEEHVQHEEFAKIIDNYRRESQVVINRVEALKPKTSDKNKKARASSNENFLRHRYRINLMGSFQNYLRFINKIENHTRFLKIDEIKIKPLGAQDSFESSGDEKSEIKVLDKAKNPIKEIELIISTYTYKKDEKKEVVPAK